MQDIEFDFDKVTRVEYGNEGLDEIKKVLDKNQNNLQVLYIYDTMSEDMVRVKCKSDKMIEAICIFVSAEHDFPEWYTMDAHKLGIVVGLRFTRGRIDTGKQYEYDGTLKEMKV